VSKNKRLHTHAPARARSYSTGLYLRGCRDERRKGRRSNRCQIVGKPFTDLSEALSFIESAKNQPEVFKDLYFCFSRQAKTGPLRNSLRRSAFQEAIAHLGKAIEMADKAAEDAPRPAAGQTMTGQRLRLQTAYGSALLHGRGMQSPETHRAFSRAQELAAGPGDPSTLFGRVTSFAANWRRYGKSRNLHCAKSKGGLLLLKLSSAFASTPRLNGSPVISPRRVLFSNARVTFSIHSFIAIRRFVSPRT
jgi:hypothetical protein